MSTYDNWKAREPDYYDESRRPEPDDEEPAVCRYRVKVKRTLIEYAWVEVETDNEDLIDDIATEEAQHNDQDWTEPNWEQTFEVVKIEDADGQA